MSDAELVRGRHGGIPAAHAASHENGGSDEVSVAGLSGQLADDQPFLDHQHTGAVGDGSQVAHSDTTGQTADDHHAQDHASSHSDGGTDEVSVESLATTSSDVSAALRPDGTGGLAFSDVAHSDTTGQGTDDHHAMQHALGAAADHTSATLSELNALVSDATLDDSGDSRPPTGAAGGGLSGTYPNPSVTPPAHSATTGQTANDHHAQLHASSHSDGGTDALTTENQSTAATSGQTLLGDGSGGWTLGIPSYSDVVQFTWQPSGSASGNVYTDWATLMTARASSPGYANIIVDQTYDASPTLPTTGMPVAGWDMTNTSIGGIDVFTKLFIPEGVKFQKWRRISSDLEIKFTGTTSPVQDLSGLESFDNFGGSIKSDGGGALFTVPDGVTLAWRQNSGKIENGSYESFAMTGTSTIMMFLYYPPIGANLLEEDTIRGVATSAVNVFVYSGSDTVSTTQTNLPVSIVKTLSSSSAATFYDPTGDTHTGSAGNAEGAVKALDAAIEVGTEPTYHKVDASEVTAGYITLPSTPKSASSVKIWKSGGLAQNNNQLVGTTGVTPDYDVGVDGGLNVVSINDNGLASGLSGLIIAGDVLMFSYEV